MKYILVSVLCMGMILMSGMIDINIEHHLNLPQLQKSDISTKYMITPLTPFFIKKEINIYLSNEIQDMGYYADVSKAVLRASAGDSVIFHLNGYGGSLYGVLQIQSAIFKTLASVIMSVEGPAISGHAYLALTPGTELIMAPNTYLMLHFSTILNLDCTTEHGTDRGVSKYEHCKDFKDISIIQNNTMIDQMSLLTSYEKTRIRNGYDVYLTKVDVEARQARLKAGYPLEDKPIHVEYNMDMMNLLRIVQ